MPTANLLDFVTENGGLSYDLCHFWSNFELGDLRWFRSAAYQVQGKPDHGNDLWSLMC